MRCAGLAAPAQRGGEVLSTAAPAATASRPWWAALLLCVVAAAVAAVGFGLAFPDRTDYLGHFIAGAGGTLLLLAPVVAVCRAGSWWRVLGVVVGILGGVVTEATVFKIAIFDPVDLANQSLGAVLVGAGLLDARRSRLLGAAVFMLGVVMLAAGFHYAIA